MYAFPLTEALGKIGHLFCARAIDQLPAEFWWLPALAVVVLAGAAAIDTFTEIWPDVLIFPGVLAIVATFAQIFGWHFALVHLVVGILGAFFVWVINLIWFILFKKDILKMGDMKWTMMAVATFGSWPVLVAWGIATCLVGLWVGVGRLLERKEGYVHFAPFLFVGLMGTLWVLKVYP